VPKLVDRARNALPSGLALLGIGGCALCCALPLLLAAGVLSGGVATLLADWMPGVAAALVAAAALAWWWVSRRRGCASCGSNGACSCSRKVPARR
jgi:mercuric ion transport protein